MRASGLAALAAPALLVVVPLTAHAVVAGGDPRWSRLATGLAALSHSALYGGLGAVFAGSLGPGRTALVSRLALLVEPCPSPDLLDYTRRVTWLWAGFCAAQLAGSALLALAAPRGAWSAWVNVLDLPLVALTFLLEYAVRRVRFRHHPLASLRDCVRVTARAFSRDPARRNAARRNAA